MDAVENVDIDGSGKFKYILIKVTDKASKESKLIVRGYERCGYHGDILDEVSPGLEGKYSLDCVGGGRIIHDPNKKHIEVFGYSQGYGQADHAKAVEILKTRYPNYSFSKSNDGY